MILLRRLAAIRPLFPKMAADAVAFAVAYALAFKARLETVSPPYDLAMVLTMPWVVSLKVVVFHYTGNYRNIWRYASVRDLEKLGRGTVLSTAGVIGLAFLLPAEMRIPRSVPFIDLALTLLLMGGLRMAVRIVHETRSEPQPHRALPRRLMGVRADGRSKRALVVGAGDAGEMIVREMIRNSRMDYDPVGFVDDDEAKLGQSIHGVSVLGTRHQIPRLVKDLSVDDIIIAIPSLRGRQVREIVQICRNTPTQLKILPDMGKIVGGTVRLSDLRKVQVEDLLGREPAELDLQLISAYLRSKRILVTGAGGSIGSELCRQILKFGPSEILLLGRGENSIYEIHRELSKTAGLTRLVQLIGDVINKKKLEGVFTKHRPEIVFHAGADKHVPLMEWNPDEAVFNNIIGTKNVLEVANEFGVERVVCISTDKAVSPTSVMGCCKRVAELLVGSHLYGNTVAVAVRFGNVLGSRGSVIPHFERQIAEGGPITLTHRDIRRYFMTIPEAAGLVIQAGAMGKGREIFVLDMGEPVRIMDLAVNMIRLAGLEPGADIEIVETGLRPGEKLEEELVLSSETAEPTSHPKITCLKSEPVDTEALLRGIDILTEGAIRMDFTTIRNTLSGLVPEFGSRSPKTALQVKS